MLRLARPLAAAALLALAAGAQAQGVLSFEALDHDFGSVNEGEKPSFTFTFTNTGDRPLTLISVQPSCGCTTPSYSTDPVAPGTQGHVTVEYNSEGRPGEFNKSIAIQAEGAEPGGATLHITGTVIPANIQNGVAQGHVTFDSDTHTYPSLKADEPANHIFRMQNTGDRPIRIVEAHALTQGVDVAYPGRPVFPNDVVEIAVSVPSVAAVVDARGQLDVAIVVTTDDPDQPAKSLRLRGRVEGTGASASGMSSQSN